MARKTKFLWCPVCMVHTYHEKGDRGWHCIDESHDELLQRRDDPWIEKYRSQNETLTIILEEGGH